MPTARTPRRILLGIALVSGSLLATQVALTRIYSVLLWYHFASLAISLTLLGFAISGVALYTSAWLRSRDPEVLMSGSALAFAATTMASALLITSLDVSSSWRLLLCMIVLLPFFCAGLCISVALRTRPDDVARVYFADLLGSALGCIAVVAALNYLGGRNAVIAAAVLAAIGGAALMPTLRIRIAAAALIVLGSGAIALPEAYVSRMGAVSQRHGLNPRGYVASRWNSFSRVDYFIDRAPNFARELLIRIDPENPLPPRVLIVIDGWAQTDILMTGDLGPEDVGALDNTLTARAFELNPRRSNVLVIGAGGGVDVVTALRFGASHVDAVEINPLITNAVGKWFADEAGHLYSRPEVDAVTAEGRNFLERSSDRYDLILLSGVDTQAATEAGAFALSENYLYTTEAMRSYLGHLNEGGFVALRRWRFRPPRQTLRLVAMAAQALEERGARDPSRNIMVLGLGNNSLTLIKDKPIEPNEVLKIATNAQDAGYQVLYSPFRARSGVYDQLLRGKGRAAFIAEYPFDVSPSTDDRPFFFEHLRWLQSLSVRDQPIMQTSGQFLLVITLVMLFGLLALFVLFPLLAKGGGKSGTLRREWRLLTYFYAIGLAFIMIEMSLMQRFILVLGLPTYSLTVVLFGLLASSAVGARLTEMTTRVAPARVIAWSLGAVSLLGFAYAFWLVDALHGLLQLSTPARIGFSIAAIAPLGVVMGMPFPLGIRVAARRDPELVPWLWAMNGHASVLGAVGGVILAIGVGFTVVSAVAAALYGLAALLLLGGGLPERFEAARKSATSP